MDDDKIDNYWNGEFRFLDKDNIDLVQARLDKRGKVCTTCNNHMPFEWFPTKKNGALANRCKWCKKTTNSKYYNSHKSSTRKYHRKPKFDQEFWDKSELFIDHMVKKSGVSREEFLKTVFESDGSVCVVASVMKFQPLEQELHFQDLIKEVKPPKVYKRGKNITTKFKYITEYAESMSEATAREIIFSCKDGIRKDKMLAYAAIYKLNSSALDAMTGSDAQKYAMLGFMFKNLVSV